MRLEIAWTGAVAAALVIGATENCRAETDDPLPSSTATAATLIGDSNPYSVISGRNVFHLNPPPPPAPAAEKGPPPALPQVSLSGFMRTGGHWKVLLVVKTKDPTAGGHETTTYMSLGQGEKREAGATDRKGVIEVAKLDADQGKVDIINCGAGLTLTLKDNGVERVAPGPTATTNRAVELRREFRDAAGMTPAMVMRATRLKEEEDRAAAAAAAEGAPAEPGQ